MEGRKRHHRLSPSVVVGDFNVERMAVFPDEAYPELVVDTDRVLAGPIPLQGLKPVARRYTQIHDISRRRQHCQLAPGSFQQVSWKALGQTSGGNGFRRFVSERFDHSQGQPCRRSVSLSDTLSIERVWLLAGVHFGRDRSSLPKFEEPFLLVVSVGFENLNPPG